MKFGISFLFAALFAEEGAGGGAGGSTIFNQGSQGDQGGGGGGGGGAGAGNQGNQGNQGGAGGGDAGAFSWKGVITEEGAFAPDWTTKLPDDLKSAGEFLKTFKNPTELARSAFNSRQLLGAAGNKIALPTPNSKPEEVAQFRKAVGAPEKWEDYGLKMPDNAPKEMEWSDGIAKTFGETMLKHHIPKAAAADLLNAYFESQKEGITQRDAASRAMVQDGIVKLKTEWGAEFGANIKRAEAMLPHVGLTTDHPAMAFPEVVAAFAKIHKMMAGEDTRLSSTLKQQGDQNSPGTIAKDIMTNKANPKYEMYQKGDKGVAAEINALLEQQAKLDNKQ
jgi:hypothetical protein